MTKSGTEPPKAGTEPPKAGTEPPKDSDAKPADDAAAGKTPAKSPAKEVGGRDGLDPTRYGDWEKAGRAVDF
jgi:hypothetical protein